jgi:hypothetical protein
MSFAPVDLFLKDTSPLEHPIPDVVVRVLSFDGKLLYTQTFTDDSGRASFLLPDQATYQIRFYKFGLALPNPKFIEVLPAPGLNSFDVAAEVLAPPIPADARLCTCFGYFRNPDGSPADSVDMSFIPKFRPLLLDGSALLVERTIIRTDERGYAQVNLIRNGQYDVTLQGMEDMQRRINVPDAPNVNLPDLLFPVISQITFDPPGPYTLNVGDEMQLTPTVHTSDGNTTNAYDVIWGTSDANVLGVLIAGGVITIRGGSIGIGYVTGTRADQTIVRIPDSPIIGVPLPVVVQ